jgi:hypothetical protein
MYMGSGDQVKVIKSDNISLTPLSGTKIMWEGETVMFDATHVMVMEMDKSIQSFAWSKDWGKWVEDPFLIAPLLYIYNAIVG